MKLVIDTTGKVIYQNINQTNYIYIYVWQVVIM